MPVEITKLNSAYGDAPIGIKLTVADIPKKADPTVKSEVGFSTKNLKTGKYSVHVQLGNDNDHWKQEKWTTFTVHEDAKAFADAALDKMVNTYYKEKGFVSADGEYKGLSQAIAGTGVDWEAWMFTTLGYKIDGDFLAAADGAIYLDMKENKYQNWENLFDSKGEGPIQKALARPIIGIAAAGGDPRNISDKNLVETLVATAYENNDVAGGKLRMDSDGYLHLRSVETDILCESYFLLGCLVANATPEEGFSEELKALAVKTIIDFWKDTDYSSKTTYMNDYWSMSMYPLGLLQDDPKYAKEVKAALAHYEANYEQSLKNISSEMILNPNSIAVAFDALFHCGIDLQTLGTDKKYARENGSELSLLLSLQQEDGSIGFNGNPNRMSTYQTLGALVELTTGKSVYRNAYDTYMETYPQYSDDSIAAEKVTKTLKALPDAANITLDHKTAVTEARAAYDSLTETGETMIPSDALAKLTAVEAKITELENTEPTPDPEKPIIDVKIMTDVDSSE